SSRAQSIARKRVAREQRDRRMHLLDLRLPSRAMGRPLLARYVSPPETETICDPVVFGVDQAVAVRVVGDPAVANLQLGGMRRVQREALRRKLEQEQVGINDSQCYLDRIPHGDELAVGIP